MQHFFGSDGPPAAERPAPLVEVRPQAWAAAPRQPAKNLVQLVQVLDAPVPQLGMGEELARFLQTLFPDDQEFT